jgi:hypothetical protein
VRKWATAVPAEVAGEVAEGLALAATAVVVVRAEGDGAATDAPDATVATVAPEMTGGGMLTGAACGEAAASVPPQAAMAAATKPIRGSVTRRFISSSADDGRDDRQRARAGVRCRLRPVLGVVVHDDTDLVAYVVGDTNPEALQGCFAGRLPEHMIPTAWVVLSG